MRTIFVFTYYSYRDPVFQSAVLPYLKLVKSTELRFILLTWEKKEFALTKTEVENINSSLLESNIIWHRTKWNSGRLKPLKKIYDFTKGMLLCTFLINKYKAHKIYTEGFPGAVVGHYLSKFLNKKHIVHTFEPHADYMRDAKVWTKKSWEYKLLKSLEVPIANKCESIITGTSAYKNKLISMGVKSRIWVIPSCIDFDHFNFMPQARKKLRMELRVDENQILIVYMGKMGGMYMEEEIFKFFSYLSKLDKELFKFLLLTNVQDELIQKYCEKYNVSTHHFFVSKDQVPEYLSAADIGFCGVRPIHHQKYSSPIKNGEYWACGLPLLIPEGIASDDQAVLDSGLGASFVDFNDLSKNSIYSLTIHSRTKIREKAIKLRDIKNFEKSFKEIFLN